MVPIEGRANNNLMVVGENIKDKNTGQVVYFHCGRRRRRERERVRERENPSHHISVWGK